MFIFPLPKEIITVKLLLIEDEDSIAKSIISYLQADGYLCDWETTLSGAKEKAWNFEYDCLLIDINLPDGSGTELIAFIKSIKSTTGIIVVSANGSITDKVEGLELGADDYISKPFDLAELSARLKAVLRRKNFDGQDTIAFGDLEVIPFNKEVKVKGQPIKLTKKEYELLFFFISNPNRVISKETIAERLWGEYSYGADSFHFIYSHLKNLRKKIQEKGGKNDIETVYGLGYKLSM